MKHVRITLYKGGGNEWRWDMVSRNGNTLGASTEGYKRLGACVKNFHTVTGLIVPPLNTGRGICRHDWYAELPRGR